MVLNPPAEMVGYYWKLAKMVKDIDPLVDLIAKHDEKYDALMTDLFMNSMYRVDDPITTKITQLLNLDLIQQRNLLVLLVKRFIHSLGFEFLNMRITLYVWDHLIMRVYPMGIEIFLVMALSFRCLKEQILQCTTWDQLVEVYYQNAKLIDFRQFVKVYEKQFKQYNFYEPVYKNAEVSDVDYSIDNGNNEPIDQSVIQDVTKKAAIPKQPINKHNTLLNRPVKKPGDVTHLKEIDPELEQAMMQNLRMDHLKNNDQIGNFPYINMDEEDGEDLLD
jgi:hypothetical protein